MLYVSCAWAPATRKLDVRKILNTVQSNIARKACWVHHAVFLHYTLILLRLRPLYIGVKKTARVPKIGFESVKELDCLAIVGPHVYTGGTRIDGEDGAALTEWRNG
ncbi:hypothetical protein EVAR_82585_1 [Eumeta japonica]|uniref:Uncharacterized protein n=1 Tax=Eumeta variegata TaxID=151549 RepID=A0A4C1UWH3_EUMVA|nr:hypothetical protein EVAR_82585_1 [Eumeta japonica]